jgi:large subunit ribosomal protein L1
VKTIIPPKELEEFMKRVPTDDVWIRKHYPAPRYRLVDTLLMHRELASPEMHDNMDGLVVADLELDMSTKKKTKFLGNISGTVLYHHSFDDGVQNRVIAITKDLAKQEEALKMGATFAGGLDVIKLIERGEIRHDDYDHVVCDTDIMAEVAIIKKHLKDNFPSRKKGTLGPDISVMVNLFVKGRTFESVKDTESLARLSLNFGRLSMSDMQLSENFQALVDTVSSLKSASLSKLISKVIIRCPPSSEAFVLQDSEIVPNVSATVTSRVAAATETVADDDEKDEAEEKEMDEEDVGK